MNRLEDKPAAQAWHEVLQGKRSVSLDGWGSIAPKSLSGDDEEDESTHELILEYLVTFSVEALATSIREQEESGHEKQVPTVYEGWIALSANQTFADSVDEIASQAMTMLALGDGPPLSSGEFEALPEQPPGAEFAKDERWDNRQAPLADVDERPSQLVEESAEQAQTALQLNDREHDDVPLPEGDDISPLGNELATARRLVQAETGPRQIEAVERLITLCHRLGRFEPAIAGLEVALSGQPENPWLFSRLKDFYEMTGDRSKQAALTFWAAERIPDPNQRSKALRDAGEIFMRKHDLTSATAAFQQAIALRPGDVELSLLMTDVLIEGGQLAEGSDILESLTKKAPQLSPVDLSSVQHRQAKLAAARGDREGRLAWLKRAFETNRKNGFIAIELADLAEAESDFDLALQALRAVTLLRRGSPMSPAMAFFRQARIAQRTGDRPRALDFAKRALREDPRLSEASDFLTQIERTRYKPAE
jgi:tetratricopeptide (TPR) repeat protein